MEALIFLLDLLFFTYLLWVVLRFERAKPGRSKSLGFFAYKKDLDS